MKSKLIFVTLLSLISSMQASEPAAKRVRIEDPAAVLLEACEDGNLEMVRTIIEAHSDLLEETLNDELNTPLIVATIHGHLPIVQYLCEQGANLEEINEDSDTALTVASTHGHLPIVQYLCGRGANLEHADIINSTALMNALIEDKIDVALYLIGQGASVTHINETGRNALILALITPTYSYNLITTIIKKMSPNDLNHVDSSTGQFPLEIATRRGHVDLLNLMLGKGANVNQHNGNNITAAIIACLNPGQLDVRIQALVLHLLVYDYNAVVPEQISALVEALAQRLDLDRYYYETSFLNEFGFLKDL